MKYEELSSNTVAFISYRHSWLKAPRISSFLQDISATMMSTDMSQIGIALFPCF